MTRQRVVKFGSTTPLGGVLTEPPAGVDREQVGVIILNSGILHHVGANRLHVQLARRLAEGGFVSLRFDFSGIGDSESRRDDLSFEKSSPIETREAVAYLTRSHGLTKVVLMGLCSGADAAHLSAIADDRVAGLALLDPWVYETRGYYFHYYAYRLVRPSVYANWLKIRFGRLRNRFRPMETPDAEMYEMPEYIREFPPREQVATELRAFLERDVELMVLFSGGLPEYNHLGQYRAAFPELDFGEQLHEAYVPGATHVFSALEHQAFVVRELSAWMARRFSRVAKQSQARSDVSAA